MYICVLEFVMLHALSPSCRWVLSDSCLFTVTDVFHAWFTLEQTEAKWTERLFFFFLHFVVLYEEALCVKICFKWKTGIIWDGMFKVSWSLKNNILHQNVLSIIKSIIFNYLSLCMHFILVCLLLKYDVFLSEKVYSARLSIRIWYDGAKYVFYIRMES